MQVEVSEGEHFMDFLVSIFEWSKTPEGDSKRGGPVFLIPLLSDLMQFLELDNFDVSVIGHRESFWQEG
jgi:hypothetical protein